MASLNVEDSIALCEEICEMVDELPERAEEFGDSVKSRTLDIQRTIEERNHVTAPQQSALENMKAGCEKWINR